VDHKTQQVTDGYGRTFFLYEESKLAPVTRKAINWDPNTRIPNMIESPRLGARLGASPGAGPVAFGKDTDLYYWRSSSAERCGQGVRIRRWRLLGRSLPT
jgi:hypothetical protein